MTPPLPMMSSVPLMKPDELERARPPDGDEAGFGSLVTDQGALPLEAMEVAARVVGLVSHTVLSQTFVNGHGEPIEATYIFPLPDRAAVTRFRMEVAGRVIDGVLEERGKARRQYDEAIASGHRAAITEEERPGVFTLRVGNLLPGERAVIRLEMTGPVSMEESEATYRFPLVVAPRYVPGTPLSGPPVGDGVVPDTDATPDASRISPPVLLPGFPDPVRLDITLAIEPAGLAISDVRSSLHTVVTEQRGSGYRLRVQPGERLDRDFIVRFSAGAASLGTSLILAPAVDRSRPGHSPEPGDQAGTFVLTLVPPAPAAEGARPREVVFVLDRSGSMDGWKMVTARRAVARMVDTLSERDRFAVLAFDNVIEAPPSLGQGLVAASDRNRFRAVEFLAALGARGGTQMATPLARAADALAGGHADTQRILVLVTDGQVGNEDQILRAMGARLENVRVFTLGVDRAVNEGFLKRLAALGGGRCALVESEDRLDEVMAVIHQRIAPPVITELAVHGEGGLEIERETLVPQRLPDLVAGAPVVISGRYRGTGQVAVSGQQADGGSWRQSVAPVLGEETADAAAVTAMWARGAVRELEDRYVTGRGDTQALMQRIIDLSRAHSVLCRFTAFVAVDRSEQAHAGGTPHKVVQPVEPPSGWGAAAGAAPAYASRTLAAAPMLACARFSGSSAKTMMGMPAAAPPGAPPPARARMSQESLSRVPPAAAAQQRPRPPAAPRPSHAGLRTELSEHGDDQREGMPSMDITPYLTRLGELAKWLERDLQAGVTGARVGVLMRALGELAEDLESADGPADVVAALRALAGALGRAAESDPASALQEALSAMKELLAGHGPAAAPSDGSAPGSSRRDSFWR